MDKTFLTVAELADLLSVNRNTVYRLVERGDIPCHQIGRAKRFSRDDVNAFLSRVREIRPKGDK
jgi:excisionase family DNA binding protein